MSFFGNLGEAKTVFLEVIAVQDRVWSVIVSNNRNREDVIISEHLAELRGRVRVLTWVSGLSWTILVLFGGLLVSGLMDWMIHFDDPGLRLVIGLSLLGAAGVMAWRQLFMPLIQPLTATFLAMRIERRTPLPP